MDSHLSRIDRYRALLRQPLPSHARHTLEWLLVDAARVGAAEAERSRPWKRYPAPHLVAIADEAVTEAVRLMGSQFANMQLYIATRNTLLML
ncbi:MAG TPA: hypothetical protein VFS49_09725, partial [Croceibacterium sp.]|nr:hypothetical protein [Croceibacterium sp.]